MCKEGRFEAVFHHPETINLCVSDSTKSQIVTYTIIEIHKAAQRSALLFHLLVGTAGDLAK